MPADEIEWLFGGKLSRELSTGEHGHLSRQPSLGSQTRHRISNMLAVVRSIARRTAATSRTLDEYSMNFDGRLAAYSRFLALLPDGADGLEFGYLLAEELLTAQAREGDQVSASGPDIRLQPGAAEIISLAFHELTTNSIKHGAFGQPEGKVAVSWRIECDASGEALVFEWVESCGPPLTLVPRRRGFGFELLEDMLAFQLDAQTDLLFEATGFRCRIRLPVSAEVFVLPPSSRLATE